MKAYEITPNPTRSDISKDEEAKHTAELFLYAMEQSCTGPPRGTMTLTDDEGVAAFLRATNYLFSLKKTKDIEWCTRNNEVNDNIASDGEWQKEFILEKDFKSECKICKVNVSPLLILLHIDQGFFNNPKHGYTPFASFSANICSVQRKHVEDLIEGIVQGTTGAAKTEDFSITPFEVCPDGSDGAGGSKKIGCTLSRDKENDVTVVGKTAIAPTR
jgi:hypothetical protein